MLETNIGYTMSAAQAVVDAAARDVNHLQRENNAFRKRIEWGQQALAECELRLCHAEARNEHLVRKSKEVIEDTERNTWIQAANLVRGLSVKRHVSDTPRRMADHIAMWCEQKAAEVRLAHAGEIQSERDDSPDQRPICESCEKPIDGVAVVTLDDITLHKDCASDAFGAASSHDRS